MRQVERETRARLQICSGAEGLVARSGQDDNAHIVVLMRSAEAIDDARDHRRIQRVALVGPVNRDPECVAAFVVQHRCIRHF